jgi:hypothetical protein
VEPAVGGQKGAPGDEADEAGEATVGGRDDQAG